MSSSGRTNRINNAAFIQNRQTMPVKTHLGALYAGRVTQFGSFYAIGMYALGSWGQYVCLFVCDVNAIFILCRLCMKQRKTLFDLFHSAIRMKHSRQHLHIDRVTEVTAVFENEKEEEDEQKKQHTQLSDYNLSFFFLWKMSFIVFPLCAILQRNNYLPTILQTTLFGLFCKIHFFSPSLSLSLSSSGVRLCHRRWIILKRNHGNSKYFKLFRRYCSFTSSLLCECVCVYAAFCVSIQRKYIFVLGFFYIVVAVIVVMSLLSVVLLSKIGWIDERDNSLSAWRTNDRDSVI